MQNFGRFYTTSEFDREYLANRKSILSTRAHSTFGEKTHELWSTNKKVIGADIDQLKRTFCGRLHFGLWGVLPPQIFTRVTD